MCDWMPRDKRNPTYLVGPLNQPVRKNMVQVGSVPLEIRR